MYNDFSNANREAWKFTYKGSELLAAATRKRDEYLQREKKAREEASKLMGDMNISTDNADLARSKNEASTNGKLREQCDVFVHEFKRTPDREFHLYLGDVTFFGLQESH